MKRIRGSLTGLFFAGLTSCSHNVPVGVTNSPIRSNIVYSENVKNNLTHIYDGKTRELPICLLGEKKDESYYVLDIKIPFIHHADNHESSFSLCNEEGYLSRFYLGIIHNHIYGDCIPSNTDMQRFMKDERAKIEALICGPQNLSDSINIQTWIKENLPDNLKDPSNWRN